METSILEIPPNTKEAIPAYENSGQDHTAEWNLLLQGDEANFPIEASFANHYFNWEHIIDGEKRNQFDCSDTKSFKLIPPEDYLKAYKKAKASGEI